MSTPITRPLAAHKIKEDDLSLLNYPLRATPKIDGIRCIVKGGAALTKSFKKVPNRHMQYHVAQLPEGLDGELILPGKPFNEISSAVMSRGGEPYFEYHVFDYVPADLDMPYELRLLRLAEVLRYAPSFVKIVPTTELHSRAGLLKYEDNILGQGYEGVMMRRPRSPYKCGRSTLKEAYLIALKRFEDSEAEIIGFEEQMHNGNELQKSELGFAKRSSHKANKVPAGTLGALICRDLKSKVVFKLAKGVGLDERLRLDIYTHPKKYMGRICVYTFQKVGTKDKPRISSFKGWRDRRDM